MNVALCYKGCFNVNYLRNFGITEQYLNTYQETLKNHKTMLWDMLGEHNIDVINATSFISDDFHKLLNNYFKNCNTIFEDKNAIYFDTWTAQLNYYLKIIDSIKQNQLKNIFYDLFIFTRLDLQFHKPFLEHNINFDKFNITVEHKSKNCDDNYWVFPQKYFNEFEQSILELYDRHQTNKNTGIGLFHGAHEINHHLTQKNIPINYMDKLIDAYMGHTIFSFIR